MVAALVIGRSIDKKCAAVSLPISGYWFRFRLRGLSNPKPATQNWQADRRDTYSFTPTIRICKIYSFYASYKVCLSAKGCLIYGVMAA
jgi:hypothetical protein